MKHTTETDYLTIPLPVSEEKAPDWWVVENSDFNKGRKGIQNLTKIKYLGNRKTLYRCICGKTHIAEAGQVNIGNIRSCGCLHRKPEQVKKMKHRERQKRYYSKNLEACRKRSRAYFLANKDIINAKRRVKRQNERLRSNGIGQHQAQAAGRNN